MTDKVIGIHLIGGPKPLDGHNNVYDAEDLGGWPPPDELVALATSDWAVAIALPENVPDEHKSKMTWYRKVRQSQMDEPPENVNYFRGATYEVKES
jgi:hypothetical protein